MDPIFKWVTRGNAKKKIMMTRLPSIKLDKLDKLGGLDVLVKFDEYVEFLFVVVVTIEAGSSFTNVW